MSERKKIKQNPETEEAAVKSRDSIMAEFNEILAAKQTNTEIPVSDDVVGQELARSGWGTESYPILDLRLDAKDQRLLTLVDIPPRKVAKFEGWDEEAMVATFRLVQAKQEALRAADDGRPFDELHVRTQNTIILTGLFGKRWMTRDVGMINDNAGEVIKEANELDSVFGESWKSWPSLVRMAPYVRKKLIRTYDREFGLGWRKYPGIIAMAPDVVEERIHAYDVWLGEEWRERPGLVKTPPRTVISSIKALETVGITQENTGPATYTTLVATSMRNKRDKAAMIRRELLGHKFVVMSSEKRSLAENVNARAGYSEADRVEEAKEVAQFREFIPRMTSSRLVSSETAIKNWARKQPDVGVRSHDFS